MRRLLPLCTLSLLLAAGPAAVISPGKWTTTVEIVDVQMAGAPPGIAAAMKNHPTTVTACITPQQAAQGPRAALPADSGCRFTQYSAEGGRIASAMTCTRPNGTLNVVSRGSYTPISYTVTGNATMTGRTGMTMTTRTSGKRVGGC